LTENSVFEFCVRYCNLLAASHVCMIDADEHEKNVQLMSGMEEQKRDGIGVLTEEECIEKQKRILNQIWNVKR